VHFVISSWLCLFKRSLSVMLTYLFLLFGPYNPGPTHSFPFAFHLSVHNFFFSSPAKAFARHRHHLRRILIPLALANAIDEKDIVIEGPTAPQSAIRDSSYHPSLNSTRYTTMLCALTPAEIPSKRKGCDRPRWCTPVFVKEHQRATRSKTNHAQAFKSYSGTSIWRAKTSVA
jgi:hypothetical protein